MDEQNQNPRPANPRRRRRSRMQIIKEDSLPAIIIGISLILVVWFIIGSIVRAVQNSNYKKEVELQAQQAAHEEQQRLEAELRLAEERKAREEAKRLDTIRHNIEQTLGRKIEHKQEQER